MVTMKKTNNNNMVGAVKASLLQLIEEYRASLQALNRSPKTIAWYQEIIKAYFDFLELKAMLKPVGELGTKELNAYLLHLQNTPRWAKKPHIKCDKGKLSPHSIQGHARCLKAFWGWLAKEGYVEHNPLAKFPLPKVPDKPVKILAIEQIQKLLVHIDKNTPRGAMYYAAALILVDTGVRVSELINIKLSDLDLTHGFVEVTGKGPKVRTVPFSTKTRKELFRYVNKFRPHLCPDNSPYLFPTPEGNHISVNGMQQFLRRLAMKAGLDGIRVSPHILRHTFATMAVAGGANVLALKDIMGHNCLATTMKYTHLQPHDLQLQHATFSPVAKLFSGKSQ
jgi:site-specific recombinase XerD